MRREPDKLQLRAREDFVSGYFQIVNGEMKRQGVKRSTLAERMGCAPANVTQILKQTGNLTAASMVDLAYHLGVKLKLDFLPQLPEDKNMNGKVTKIERNIYNAKTTRLPAPEWQPKKNGNGLMKLGA